MTESSVAIDRVSPDIIQKLVLDGDLGGMNESQKVDYYEQFCNSLGLNPLTQPFQIIKFQGKQKLYATKDATEQLRKIYKVSILDLDKLFNNDLYVVTAKAQDGSGRTDASTGVVNIKGLYGDNLANAIMKAETKAKRRVTLSICGLGMLDESELDTMPDHQTTNKGITPNDVVDNRVSKTDVKRVNHAENANKINDISDLQTWFTKLSKPERKEATDIYLQREEKLIMQSLDKIEDGEALEVFISSLSKPIQERYASKFYHKREELPAEAVIIEETDKDMFGNLSKEKELEISISKLTKTSNFEAVDASLADVKDSKERARLAKLLYDKTIELGVSYSVETIAF